MSVRIATEGSFNLELLKQPLAEAWREAGLKAETRIGPYQQYPQQLLNSQSSVYAPKPDLLLLVLHGKDILAELDANPLKVALDEAQARAVAAAAFQTIQQLIGTFTGRATEAVVFVTTVVGSRHNVLGDLPVNAGASLDAAASDFNAALCRWAAGQNRVFVLDAEDIVRGMGERQAYDDRLWYLARTPWSRAFFRELAARAARMWSAFHGRTHKCLCLDLDNTLWGGIVGEDGIGGLQLGGEGIGFAYKEFQSAIEQLRRRGILILLNSKNNLDDAKEVFEKHPEMVLRWEVIAAHRINWRDKPANMRELSEELNLGLDSIVFLDDNPVERELIRKALPQVATPEFPGDPAMLVRWFTDLCHERFNTLRLTREDIGRPDQYAARRKAEELKSQAASVEDYLRSLEMKVIIRPLTRETLPRVAQLTQKTNQFNLTTRCYTEAELERLSREKDTFIFSAQLKDKFADNGIVAVIIIRPEDAADAKAAGERRFLIDTFLMSCRVIGRTLEAVFLNCVVNHMYSRYGDCIVRGRYIPTKKNDLVKDLYERLGFSRSGDNDCQQDWLKRISESDKLTSSNMEIVYEGQSG